MKMFKSIFAVMLAVLMLFVMCSCDNGSADTNETTDAVTTDSETTENDTTEADNGLTTYKVTVVDEENNPISGAIVQLCLDACVPSATDADGVATFNLAEADYKVSFVTMPEGYTSAETEFHFEDGTYEMTIVLSKAA